MSQATGKIEPGSVIGGRYRVQRSLGEGGGGAVFVVEDVTSAGRTLALKIQPLPEAFERGSLGHEFQVLSRLSHPNLARIHDFGVIRSPGPDVSPRCFFTRQYVEGRNLVEALSGSGPEKVREAAAALAAALRYIHSRRVVHGDIKPENIICPGGPDIGRLKIIDFGLAVTGRVSRAPGAVSGSLATMAPEVVLGSAPDELSDLYSLGASLYHAVTGTPLVRVEDPEAITDLLRKQPAPLMALRGDVPDDVARAVMKLVSRDPGDRYASAAQLLRDLNGEEDDGGMVLSPRSVLVGFEEHLAKMRSRLEASRESGRGGVMIVKGAAGSGKSRLIEEFKWQAQLDGCSVVEGSFGSGLPSGPGLLSGIGAQLAALAGKAFARPGEEANPSGRDGCASSCAASGGPEELTRLKETLSRSILSVSVPGSVIVLEDMHRAGAEDLGFARYLAGKVREEGRGPFMVLSMQPGVLPEDPGEKFEGAESIVLAEFERGHVALMVESMLGRSAPKLAAAIFAHVGGTPLLVEEAVRSLAERGRVPPDEISGDVTIDLPPDISGAVLERLGFLEGWVRRLMTLGAVYGRPWGWDEIARFLPGLVPEGTGRADFDREMDALADRNLLKRIDAEHVDFISPSVRQIVYEGSAEEERVRLHGAVAGKLDETTEDLPFAAHHLLRSRPRDDASRARAVSLAMEGASRLLARHAFSAAEAMLLQGIGLADPGQEKMKMSLLLADVLCVSGRFDEAAAFYGELLRAADGKGQRAMLLGRLGGVLEMKGAYPEADARLGEALAAGQPAQDSCGVYDALAKVKMMMGRHGEAREYVSKGIEAGPGEVLLASLYRTLSLTECYDGKFKEAHEHISSARELSRRSGDVRGEAVAENCAAIIFQRQGDLEAALERYTAGQRLYEESGYIGGLPVLLLNVGTIHYEMGSFAAALEKFQTSGRVARRLDKVSTVAASMINTGNIYIYFGALDEARRQVAEAGALARGHAMKAFEAKGELCLGEIAMLEGDIPAARASAGRALEIFTGLGSTTDMLEAGLLMGEIELGAGEGHAALEAAEKALELSRTLGHGRHEAAALCLRGRALGRETGKENEALGSLEKALSVAAGGKHREQIWRAHHGLWEFYLARHETDLAERHRGIAREILAAVAYSLPAEHRESFWSRHPLRRALREAGRPGAAAAPAASGGGDAPKLLRLLEINRKIISEEDAGRLLDLAMDTAVELFRAERGFLILKDERGKTSIAAARNIDRETIKGARLKISRSIAEKVAQTGEPLLTMSAQDDERFSSTRSVHELKLKSVMCVPIRGRERILGTITIDNRFQMSLFSDEDLRLLLSFADLIAVALENIRMREESRHRQAELEAAKAKLDEMLRKQADRLSTALRDLEAKQTALEFRYDYTNIIGRGPAMLGVLGLIERVIDSNVPVLIEGESGTGKELIARTIHFNGSRRKNHFVSLNCGALPETLLESELFGYRRGAFTDARDDKEGLLSVAHEGTIFLDEIGDMSPGMQVKMLRFLQSGEIRQLGSNEDRKVDVRVIAATHRSLQGMVKTQEFREDLFYRINVVTIRLPPLRERRGDIPALCEHFLQNFSSEMKVEKRNLGREAMEALMGYDWPGNIRELENVLKNALILSDGAKISPRDLHLKIETAARGRSRMEERFNIEVSEERNIREALGAAGGNKKEAARLLGIGRMTLYRKMKKFGIDE